MLSPERFKERAKLTTDVVEAVRRYWRGEPVQGRTGTGEEVQRMSFPRPVQAELPVWLTATRSTETFLQAGRLGVNVLTAVLRMNREELAEKIDAYRRARSEHGHDPHAGRVTLMLHAFAGSDDDQVRLTVNGPFREYLRSHMEFLVSTGAPLAPSEKENLLTLAFDRFYERRIAFRNPRVLPRHGREIRGYWRQRNRLSHRFRYRFRYDDERARASCETGRACESTA